MLGWLSRKSQTVFWKPVGNDVGYLELDGRRKVVPGIVKRTDVMNMDKTGRKDLYLHFDYDENDRLIGIEVLW